MSPAQSTGSRARPEAVTNGADIPKVFEDPRYVQAAAAVDRLMRHRGDVERRQRENEASLEEHRAGSMRRAEELLAGQEWTRADVLDSCMSAARALCEEHRAVSEALAMAETERDRVVQRVSREHCSALRGRILEFARAKIAAAETLLAIQREEARFLEALEMGGNSLNGLFRMRPLCRPDNFEYSIREAREFYPDL